MARGAGGPRGGDVGRGGRGRGEYYKNKYGGGRGRGRGMKSENDGIDCSSRPLNGGGSYAELQHCLQAIDGKSYGAYHDLDTSLDRGWVNGDVGYTLYVERAQSDPFAPPTRCRVVLKSSVAGFPPSLYSNPVRRVALADFVLRSLYGQCKQLGADSALAGKGWSGPKGGDIQILEPSQHVLEQSAIRFDDQGNIIAQLTINFPARGRSILGQAAEEILGKVLPTMVLRGLYYKAMSANQIRAHVESVEDQCWLQSQLYTRNLVAFVVNGAILSRKSGVDDHPMDSSKAVPFASPKRLEVSFELPNAGITIAGMGIPKGITLICGGGFHGKSTLLEALQVGVYPKLPGDGREFCLTSANALKVRAEDGRNVQSVDISTFINNLPFGKDTTCFSTPDASGSTSQAANIVEVRARSSATNLLDRWDIVTVLPVNNHLVALQCVCVPIATMTQTGGACKPSPFNHHGTDVLCTLISGQENPVKVMKVV
jgi:predicted ABC-class ATPase